MDIEKEGSKLGERQEWERAMEELVVQGPNAVKELETRLEVTNTTQISAAVEYIVKNWQLLMIAYFVHCIELCLLKILGNKVDPTVAPPKSLLSRLLEPNAIVCTSAVKAYGRLGEPMKVRRFHSFASQL